MTGVVLPKADPWYAGQEGPEAGQEEGMCGCLLCWSLIANCPVQLGTLLRSKRKLEELTEVIQESRRAH